MTLQVGSAYSTYTLDIAPLRRSVSEAKRLLAELRKEAAAPLSVPRVPNAPGTPRAPRPAAGEDARAANEALRLAQAHARVAVAMGDRARAASILRTAMTSATQADQRQQLAVQAQIHRLETGKTAWQQFGDTAKNSLLGIVGPAAIGTAALAGVIKIVGSFEEAFKFKAQLDETTRSINVQLEGVRDQSQVYAEASAFARQYKLTQEETTNTIAASVPILQQSKASFSEIAGVLNRLTVRNAKENIEGAAFALKELQSGDYLSLVERFNVGKDTARAMRDEIANGADAVQVLDRYLTSVNITMDTLKVKTEGVSGAMRDLKIAEEDLKLAQAEFAQGPGLAILNTRIETTRGLARLLSGDFAAMGQSMRNSASEGTVGMRLIHAITGETVEGVRELGAAAQAAAQAGSQVQAQAVSDAAALVQAMAASAAAREQAAAAIANHTVLITGDNDALVQSATVTRESALQSQIDAEAKQLQAQQTQLLTQQAVFAADAFLQLNPGIDAAGVAALVTAQKIDPLLGQLIAMRLQANEARNALLELANAQNVAAVNATVLANRNAGRIGRGDSASEMQGQAQAWTRINQERADAQREQTLATGSAADKQALLNSELDKAVKLYGANSAQAIRAQTALTQFQAQQDAKKGGGRGGAKLSDQQKLDNQLLGQQEQTNQKYADAEVKHLANIDRINREANRKLAEADKAFHQGRLDSRAGFYKQLAGVEDGALRQQLSARYEAAVLEANSIAAEQGSDAGKAYLDAAKEVIRSEGDLQAEIDKARNGDKDGEGKDADKAEYLEGVLRLEQEANRARLEEIRQSGGEIESERQRQLAEEARSFEEEQGKIAEHAENAADRTVNAAVRSGKAVSAERTEVDQLTQSYRNLNDVAGRRGGVTAADVATAGGQASAAVTPAAVGSGTAAAVQITQVADVALLDALNAHSARQAGQLDSLIGAVQSVERRVGATESAIRSISRSMN